VAAVAAWKTGWKTGLTTARTTGRLGALREALLLEGATRTAAGYAEDARARMRALVRAAREHVHAADAALEDGHAASALPLYREAALLLMAARVTVAGGEPLGEPLAAGEVLARFRAVSPTALDASVDEGTFVFVGSAAEATSRAEAARAVVRSLRGLVEPRGLAELRFVRDLRVGAAGVVAVAFLAWVGLGLFGRENIALHRPVTTSGVHPSALSPPSGLTDGVISGAPYGVHTQVGDAPWVQVDLGAIRRIDRVKIYNRGDGYLDDGLPLTLQLSENGVHFIDVDTRTASFTQVRPWVFKAQGSSARYVRVKAARGKYVALSELEVFAR
jgi:hypothetical protein